MTSCSINCVVIIDVVIINLDTGLYYLTLNMGSLDLRTVTLKIDGLYSKTVWCKSDGPNHSLTEADDLKYSR